MDSLYQPDCLYYKAKGKYKYLRKDKCFWQEQMDGSTQVPSTITGGRVVEDIKGIEITKWHTLAKWERTEVSWRKWL